MKIYTNENNTSTLKLLIAANLAGKQVELVNVTLGDKIHPGPRSLPTLEVDNELVFFSSNAAVQYLFPILDLSENGKCQEMLEWEATRLYPIVQTMLAAKTAPADLKQLFTAALKDVDKILANKKYLLGDTISAADVSLWSTLLPLTGAAGPAAAAGCPHVERWTQELGRAKAVQDAVRAWGGAGGACGAACSLGLPPVPSVSPASPLEEILGPSTDELAAAREAWLTGAAKLPIASKREKVILPIKGRKNILITSALPYVNNVPHLGNIIGCVLSADIFARYCRLCNYNALYICGTDEYGTATETKALEEGLTPREICDKYYQIHNDVYRWFNIGFDHFGRTSTPEQTEIVQKLFLKLQANGFINKQSVDQLMCEKCDRFLADRFVEGTCHHAGCGYEDARGDQCDRCGRLVNAAELLQPRCKVCGQTPVLRASEQLFIELAMLEPSVRAWGGARHAAWSPAARGAARAWLREGLRARAVTRDLKWGVPVPGGGSKVFYVWFDAPIGYMSITQAATKQYEKWWKPEKQYGVQLYQFMAKDNVPFHAIMFPATLLGVGEGHLMVDRLFATEYLNYEEGKFSKSRGVGVFGTDAQDTGIPSDVWRFYLASIRPETSDSSFSWTELGTRNNSELLNNLGNFCHRSLSFCHNSFGGLVPAVEVTAADLELFALVNREIAAYVADMERGRLRDALRRALAVSRLGNQRMQAEQPWVLLKGGEADKVRAASVIGVCCQLAACLCALVGPFVPDAARRLAAQLNVDLDTMRIDAENPTLVQYLPPGHSVSAPAPLFAKIEPERLVELRARYAGTQRQREENGVAPPSGDAVQLEAEIAKQAEVVRKLKASTKDKAVWQPEVNKLLALKKQLTEVGKTSASVTSASGESLATLEKAIAVQGEVVRKIKASTKDKAVWQPEVNKLLSLKKQLTEAGKTSAPVASASGQSVEALEKAIAEQGDKVRKLKASTKDKTVWQPEVNTLLALKKQLASLQVK